MRSAYQSDDCPVSGATQLINSDVAFKMAPKFLEWKSTREKKSVEWPCKAQEIQSRTIIKQNLGQRSEGGATSPAPQRHLASEHSIRMTLCGWPLPIPRSSHFNFNFGAPSRPAPHQPTLKQISSSYNCEQVDPVRISHVSLRSHYEQLIPFSPFFFQNVFWLNSISSGNERNAFDCPKEIK